MNRNETLLARALANTSLGFNTALAEQSRVSGIYPVVCTGPRDIDIDEYAHLRDQFWAADKVGNTLLAAELMVKLALIPTEVKWRDTAVNLVTTVGGNNMLDNHLSGSSYTATWYIGLMSLTSYTTGPALADTMASHSGWAEDVNYSNANRPTTAWSAANAKSKSLSAGLVFNMNATTTIKGCFLTSNNTKGGTTGTLFSAGLFTGGDQPVVNTNTLTVSYTASV